MIDEYGTLQESKGVFTLTFERFFPRNLQEVYSIIINPNHFIKWYPFATGEMEPRIGGKIFFDDGEGTTYEGIITEFKPPYLFSFQEIDDMIDISLKEDDKGCLMTFKHTFKDGSWVVSTAAGWHRCLDVLVQIVNEEVIKWEDNSTKLRKVYSERFNIDSETV